MNSMTRREQILSTLLRISLTDPVLAWAGPIAAAMIGGFLRFWQLDRPHQLVFDETYYVKQGWQMILFGFEMRNDPDLDAAKQVDQHFTQLPLGDVRTVFGTEGDFVVHPPVGKWLIGWGEQLFGIDSSFGWRFTVAVLGTLSIVMIGRAAYRLFRSWYLATIASLLLAFEGHHFVHSRTGLLDLILMFFALAAFCALLIDRDTARDRLAARLGTPPTAGQSVAVPTVAQTTGRGGAYLARRPGLGPRLGPRPWRWVAGVSLGLATGTKWSGLYFLVAFGVLTVCWDISARRAAGIRRGARAALVRDAPHAAISMVGGTVLAYLASWTGWFRTDGGSYRDWGATHPAEPGSLAALVPDALRSLWRYHAEIYTFHNGLTSDHPYKANPWSWIIQGRPTSFFYEGPKLGEDGCTVEQCSKAITSIGTVTIWWGAVAAIAVLLFRWLLRRDWRAGAVLAGLAGGYLPWFALQHRTIYAFYEVAFVPWVVLACVYLLGLILGVESAHQGAAGAARRRRGLIVAGAFVVATIVVFAFFYPIYTAEVIPQDQWSARMWFKSWI